jgi:[1-hydroxy-2-(trimethylamino)ethyl]phosphonate dioxygenase
MMSRGVVDEIVGLFAERGAQMYVGEPVSLTEHMLQTALEAEEDGAPPTLVAAAVLHDIGHLQHDMGEDAAENGIDTMHEDRAAAYLTPYFPAAVVEPIRLHVASKRYLCAVDPSYLAQLSAASRLSLDLQGGPFTPEEVDQFRANPHHDAAVRLRRYDDAAKIEGRRTPSLDHYRQVLEQVRS